MARTPLTPGCSPRAPDVSERPYDWNADAVACYTLALRMIALRMGIRRFETIPEMYWQERHGVIP